MKYIALITLVFIALMPTVQANANNDCHTHSTITGGGGGNPDVFVVYWCGPGTVDDGGTFYVTLQGQTSLALVTVNIIAPDTVGCDIIATDSPSGSLTQVRVFTMQMTGDTCSIAGTVSFGPTGTPLARIPWTITTNAAGIIAPTTLNVEITDIPPLEVNADIAGWDDLVDAVSAIQFDVNQTSNMGNVTFNGTEDRNELNDFVGVYWPVVVALVALVMERHDRTTNRLERVGLLVVAFCAGIVAMAYPPTLAAMDAAWPFLLLLPLYAAARLYEIWEEYRTREDE